MENPLNITSNEIRVGLGTTVSDDRYVLGNTFFQGTAQTELLKEIFDWSWC